MAFSHIRDPMQALDEYQEQKENHGLDIEFGSKHGQGNARFGNVPSKEITNAFGFRQSQSIQKDSCKDLKGPNQEGNQKIA
jgi:hypothetical protein